jgi:hypothetical protein
LKSFFSSSASPAAFWLSSCSSSVSTWIGPLASTVARSVTIYIHYLRPILNFALRGKL